MRILYNYLVNHNNLFLSKNKKEYDFVKKDWGYYATPSINSRLKKFKFLTFLIKNKLTKFLFILVVYKEKMSLFKKYLKKEKLEIIDCLSNKNFKHNTFKIKVQKFRNS